MSLICCPTKATFPSATPPWSLWQPTGREREGFRGPRVHLLENHTACSCWWRYPEHLDPCPPPWGAFSDRNGAVTHKLGFFLIYDLWRANRLKCNVPLGSLVSFRVDTSLILFLNLSFCVSSSISPDTRIVPGIEFQSMLVELTWGQGFGTRAPLSGTRIWSLRNRPLGDDLAYFTIITTSHFRGRKKRRRTGRKRRGRGESKANAL